MRESGFLSDVNWADTDDPEALALAIAALTNRTPEEIEAARPVFLPKAAHLDRSLKERHFKMSSPDNGLAMRPTMRSMRPKKTKLNDADNLLS